MKRAPSRPATIDQVSAGGVAYREQGGELEIAIILTTPERRWQLPKGMLDPGETEEEAAVREVREEAGVETELMGKIDRTEYWFTAERNGVRSRFHKYVHWFLLKYITGSVDDHDHEVAEARWVASAEALEMLEFKNERDVVEKGLLMISGKDDKK